MTTLSWTTTCAPNVTSRPTCAVGLSSRPGASSTAMPDTLDIAVGTRPPLRGAVLGLGMMGRHHARILQSHPDLQLAGAVDPGGDRHGAVHDRSRVFATVSELLHTGRPDFAVVA